MIIYPVKCVFCNDENTEMMVTNDGNRTQYCGTCGKSYFAPNHFILQSINNKITPIPETDDFRVFPMKCVFCKDKGKIVSTTDGGNITQKCGVCNKTFNVREYYMLKDGQLVLI